MAMSFLSMMEAKLPPGFRFHPRDEELVCDYLAKKISSHDNGCSMMIAVDLNKCEPWDIPETACVGGKEWYFYSIRDRKYATGQRTNRATRSGYWKATGKDKQVSRKGVLVGMRKTLVFYEGRAPKGRKTDWVMHEFRMDKVMSKEDWVLCRVFYKSRGTSYKPSMKTCNDDTSSYVLPPLTNTYIVSEQSAQSLEGYEEVSCFSNLPLNPDHDNQVVLPLPPIFHLERSMDIKNTTHLSGLEGLSSCLKPSSSDKIMIKAVLGHFTKFEGNHRRQAPSVLEKESMESYLLGNIQTSMWSNF